MKVDTNSPTVQAYNSQNTNQLDVPEMKNMLAKLDFIKKVLAGERATPDGQRF